MEEEEIELWGWHTFFEELDRFLELSVREFETANVSYCCFVSERLETCIATLIALRDTLAEAAVGDAEATLRHYLDEVDQLLDICRLLNTKWLQAIDEREVESNAAAYHAPTVRSLPMQRGRPRFEIPKEQLVYLSSLSFSWTDISRMLGVSRMTIYRRRVEYDLVRDPGNVPTSSHLRAIVREIKNGQPQLGEVMVMGRIRGMGYKVTRECVRQAIRSIDPLHIALRWRGGLTSRRPYSVPGPNSLWHIGMVLSLVYSTLCSVHCLFCIAVIRSPSARSSSAITSTKQDHLFDHFWRM